MHYLDRIFDCVSFLALMLVELYRECNKKTRRVTISLLLIKLLQNGQTVHTTCLHESIEHFKRIFSLIGDCNESLNLLI